MPDLPPLEQAVLDKLHRIGGKSFVLQMISIFLDYGSQKVGETRQAIEANNWQGVEKSVHAIKSSATNLGASRVWEVAAKMEEASREGDFDPLHGLQDQLEKEFDLAKRQLELKVAEINVA